MAISDETMTALTKAYRHWGESSGEDLTLLIDLMADDIEFATLSEGASPLEFSKPCHSKSEVLIYLQGLLGDWDLLSTEIEDIISERDLIVVLLKNAWRNRRTDKYLEGHAAHAWRFKGRRASHIRMYFDTAKWIVAARTG